MAINKEPKVAIVHDWLTNFAGAERVVEAISEVYPNAPIYTSVYNKNKVPQFNKNVVKTSFLQHWPLAKTKHQLYSKLRQIAFESFDFSVYDVVISSSTAEAKGIITPTETIHISYINTPTRYYWIDYKGYLSSPGFGVLNPLVKLVLPKMLTNLKKWDFAAAQRADVVLANSENVSARIKKYYHRSSQVLYPPVDFSRFVSKKTKDSDYYLVVSRLVPYKKTEVAIEAFSKSGKKLVVIGNGSELSKLKNMASNNIDFIENATDEVVTDYYLGCKAFIFTAEEDFGITPLEAMAAGKGVIAFSKGGALETVQDGKTGVLFDSQTPENLNTAVGKFEKIEFNQEYIKTHAKKFDQTIFKSRLKNIVEEALEKQNKKPS